MTGHFHALRCSLALGQTLVVNWGSVKQLDQSLRRGRIRYRYLYEHLLLHDAINSCVRR
jgi:hypothetical protein